MSTLTSRNQRKKELERERQQHISSTRAPFGSSNQSDPVRSHNDDKMRSNPLIPSASVAMSAADLNNASAEVCYANDGGLRGKLRVNPAGKHSFLEEEDFKFTSKSWTQEREKLFKELEREREKEKEREKEREIERERERGRLREKEARIHSRPMTPATSAKDKDAAKKRSTSVDAWKQLVAKETKARTKFYGTEKTLLVLLEEERARFTEMEEEYHKLLGEVQLLQGSHREDLKNVEKRSEADLRTLQKALVIKSEECTAAQKELQQFHGRYTRESSSWITTNDKLENHIEQLDRTLREMETRADMQEKAAHELGKQKKELSERLAQREAECRKATAASRQKEAEWAKEKELRMKMEVQALQLDHFVAQRDEEIKALKQQLAKRDADFDDFRKMKAALVESQRDVEDLTKREKIYLEELDQSAKREKKLLAELDDLTAANQRAMAEVERYATRDVNHINDIENLKAVEDKLRLDLIEAQAHYSQAADEINAMASQNRTLQSESARSGQEVGDLRHTIQDLRHSLTQRENEVLNLKEAEFQLRRDKDDLRSELGVKQIELQTLQGQLQDVAQRLEIEFQSKNDIKTQNKEKLFAVAEKISELQDTLNETQGQIAAFRKNEEVLKANLRQRDEAIASLKHQLIDHQRTISELEAHLARENFTNENLKTRKKDDLLAVQEKFAAAKHAMEQDVQQLRDQLSQRDRQMAADREEAGRRKVEVSELSADRFRLEARLTEITALESSQARQIAALQQQLRQKEQELNLTGVKHGALIDQLRRIEEELEGLRTFRVERESDVARFQKEVAEIGRKLKTQVRIAMERDPLAGLGAGGNNGGASEVRESRGAVSDHHRSAVNLTRSLNPGLTSQFSKNASLGALASDRLRESVAAAAAAASSSSARPFLPGARPSTESSSRDSPRRSTGAVNITGLDDPDIERYLSGSKRAEITLKARKRGCHLVTSEIIGAVSCDLSKVKVGLMNVFIQHTSASLSINENADPDVRVDMENSLSKLVPEGKDYIHADEGPDDMPGTTAAQFSSVLSGFAEKLKPLGSQAAKGLSQVSQYAKEKMGSVSATDITELPTKYRELEEKVDKIRALHESFLRISVNYTKPHYDYEPLLSDTAFDFASTVSDRFTTLAGGTSLPKEEIPKSLSHAFSKAAAANAASIGTEEPLAPPDAKNDVVVKDAEATTKFHQPFTTTLNQTIAHAMKARRHVQAARLNYDAARARLKTARPEREEASRAEMEATEDEFVAAVDDAMSKMTLVVESPEPLKNLADLVAAQLAYFKETYEALAELSPEIDELQVTNEALLRHPAS
ncbi:hypothetical protein HK101_006293 [Irineochytrium annulatum]|nr:hypothetical protein HK101_006293 [Irineochytrium annulatum]